MSVVLRGTDLTFEVGDRALVDGVHVELSSGEVLALTGPNGAGKSTLLRLFAGELEPTRGVVELERQTARAAAPRRVRTAPSSDAAGDRASVRVHSP